MSEVLITLGILGVVIAMTLPGLIQRYQKLAFATQLKKSVNILENGFKLEMAKADSGELAGTELWQTFPASSKGYGNSFGSAEQYEATEVILKKLFNIMFIPHERTDYENHGRGKLGDATKETLSTFGDRYGGWYSDYAFFVYSGSSWFIRGGGYDDGSGAGVFNFDIHNGGTDSRLSARAVLIP